MSFTIRATRRVLNSSKVFVPSIYASASSAIAPMNSAFVSHGCPRNISTLTSSLFLMPVAQTEVPFGARGMAKKNDKKGAAKEDAGERVEAFDNTKFLEKMTGTINHLKDEYANMRLGRPVPEQLHDIQVEIEGSYMPLKALGQVHLRPPNTLLVALHDQSYEAAVVRAIFNCGLELNPTTETTPSGASQIVVVFPRPTRELRDSMIKMAKKKAEDAKVSIRNVRKTWMDSLKKTAGSKDDIKKAENDVQKTVDKYNDQISQMCQVKEKELDTA